MAEFVDTKEYAEGERAYLFQIELKLNPYRPEYDAARYMAWRAGWLDKKNGPIQVHSHKGERNES